MTSFELTSVSADANRIYVGTYTGGGSEGIYMAAFDARTGALGEPTLAAKTDNPSFIALHPGKKFLYSVGEINSFEGKPGGAVNAYSIDPASGRLQLLNQQSSGGGGPCHVSVDPSGKCVLVANYGGGSIAAFPLAEDGRLQPAGSFIQHRGSSVNQQRQAGPHAHQIVTSHTDRVALVCDLGLDKVLVYDLDPSKALLASHNPPFASVPAGAGPRHLVFHPGGKFVYVVNEMGSSVTTFRYQSNGTLERLETVSTLPTGATARNSCAEIQVHPSGKFLYASNRGHDSIAVYAITKGGAALDHLQNVPTGGKAPRHFAIDPSGAWVLAANQDSNNIVVFRLDEKTGKLSPTDKSIQVTKPVCIEFAPGQ